MKRECFHFTETGPSIFTRGEHLTFIPAITEYRRRVGNVLSRFRGPVFKYVSGDRRGGEMDFFVFLRASMKIVGFKSNRL
jgi:hypothetical protein